MELFNQPLSFRFWLILKGALYVLLKEDNNRGNVQLGNHRIYSLNEMKELLKRKVVINNKHDMD